MASATFEVGAAKRKRFPFVLVLLVLVAATYSAAPLGDFVWDDDTLIVENERALRATSFVDFFLQPFFPPSGDQSSRNFYRPLVKASFAMDLGVWGLSPAGFHLTNLGLHLLVTLLLYLLLARQAVRVENAFFLAAAFGVAPRLTEAVAWISGRTDVLATLFCLLALHATLAPSPRPTGRRWCAAFLVLLGLFSKEVAVAAAAAIALHEWRREAAPSPASRLRRLIPIATSVAIYALLRTLAMSEIRAIGGLPLTVLERVLGSAEAIGRYSMMLVVPWSPETQIGSAGDPSWPFVGLGSLVIVLLAILGVRVPARMRHWEDLNRMGLVLFLVPLGLVAFVPIPLYVTAADRFLYLPLAGLALLTAGLLARTRAAPRAPAVIAIPLIASFAWVTLGRVDVWRTDLTLWEPEGARATSAYPLVQLAEAKARGGDPAAALPLLDRAEELGTSFQRRHPWFSLHHVGTARGLTLVALERDREAEAVFRELARVDPHRPEHRNNLAVCLVLQRRFQDSLAVLDDPSAAAFEGTRKLRRRIVRVQESFSSLERANSDDRTLRAELLSRLAEPLE